MPDQLATKHCRRCNTTKPRTDFPPNKALKSGIRSCCRTCDSRQKRDYRLANIEMCRTLTQRWRAANPDRSRVYALQRDHGISVADYDAMLASQGERCAICGRKETRIWREKVTRLAVDHNHATGAIRELLCHGCNTGIGQMREDPDLFRKAADYIEKHTPRATMVA